MARKITLDSIIAKLVNKDMLFINQEQQAKDVYNNIIGIIASGYPKEELAKKGFDTLGKLATRYLSGAVEVEALGLSPDLSKMCEEQYSRLGQQELIFTPFTDRLEALYFNAQYINYLWEWAGEPAKNGKPNFYSIGKKYRYSIFTGHKKFPFYIPSTWQNMFFRELRNKETGKRISKQEFFELLKSLELRHLKAFVNDGLGGAYVCEDYRHIIEELEALTWEIISDRHKAKPKPEKVYAELENVARIAHNANFDYIGALVKVAETADFQTGEAITVYENAVLKAIVKGNKNYNRVFTDKLLTECRIRLAEQRNINDTDSEKNRAVISIPIHDAMILFGYAENKEQAEDKQIRHDFMQKYYGACRFLFDSEFTEKTPNGRTFRVLQDFVNSGRVELTFTSRFLEFNKESHAFEYVLRSLNKIPDRRITEYFLAKKLVNNATNTINIGKGQGRENILSFKAIIEDLESKNALASGDNSYHSKRRKIERVIEAIKWLEDNDIAYIGFNDTNGKRVELKPATYYTENMDNLKELMSFYTMPELVNWIEDKRLLFEAKEEERQAAAIEGAKKKSRRLARAKAKAEAEQTPVNEEKAGAGEIDPELASWIR